MPRTAETMLQSLARTSLSRGFFGPVWDWNEHAAGYRLMLDAVLARGDLAQTLMLAASADEGRGPMAVDQRTGAMDALLACLGAINAGGKHLAVTGRAAGFELATAALQDATGERRRALLRLTPPEQGADMLGWLLMAAQAAGPYLKRADPPAPPPAQHLAVNLTAALQLPEGPLPMAIISQPSTRSVQTVERDENDEIVRTVTNTNPASFDEP
jgi:hypothetical protein